MPIVGLLLLGAGYWLLLWVVIINSNAVNNCHKSLITIDALDTNAIWKHFIFHTIPQWICITLTIWVLFHSLMNIWSNWMLFSSIINKYIHTYREINVFLAKIQHPTSTKMFELLSFRTSTQLNCMCWRSCVHKIDCISVLETTFSFFFPAHGWGISLALLFWWSWFYSILF